MRRITIAAFGALSFVTTAQVLAQDVPAEAPVQAPSAQAPAPVLTPVVEPSVLRAGTPVPLKMSEFITTKGKKLKVGHRFRLEVAEPVYLNDKVVIPAGTPAIGEVTDVKNKGMWGKSGKINARVLHMRVGDRTLRLSGQVDDKGKAGTAGVVGSVAFVPVAGFFVTGTSAEIHVGTPVNAFLDEDVSIAFAPETPPAPLVVPVPQQ